MKHSLPPSRPVRLKSRAGKRGAVILESVLVIPILIIMNAAGVFMLQAYDSKLVTMRNVNETSWASASQSCQGMQTSTKARPSAGATDSSLSGVQSQAQQALQLSVSPNVKRPFQRLQFQAFGSTAEDGPEGNSIFTGGPLSSDATVLCNEKPQALTKADERQQVENFYSRFVQ